MTSTSSTMIIIAMMSFSRRDFFWYATACMSSPTASPCGRQVGRRTACQIQSTRTQTLAAVCISKESKPPHRQAGIDLSLQLQPHNPEGRGSGVVARGEGSQGRRPCTAVRTAVPCSRQTTRRTSRRRRWPGSDRPPATPGRQRSPLCHPRSTRCSSARSLCGRAVACVRE